MGFIQRRLLKFVLVVATHPFVTLAIVGVILAAAAALAISRLTISTDQNKLFSPKAWFFRDYLQYIHRFPENEAVYVVIEPRDPSAKPALDRWTAAADQITEHLRSLRQYVNAAYCKVPLDQLGRQGALFEDTSKLPGDFEHVSQQFAPLAQIWGQAGGTAPILGFLNLLKMGASDQSASFVSALADSWNGSLRQPAAGLAVGQGVVDLKRLDAADPSQLGYFYVPNEMDRSRFRILIQVYPVRILNSLTSVTRTIDGIRFATAQAAANFPEFHVAVTGRPALEGDQMGATNIDSHHAEIVALIFVFFGMVVMLRSIWLALAAEIALGVGIGWTFGWATISVGELNLLSVVFMIALIGIGMDYLVQILTRYRSEAQRYPRAGAVWVRVFRHVGPPINTACLGAAGAFLVSIFTDFRGAADLGIIAGGGLLLCLISGYTVLPALLTIFPPRLRPYKVATHDRSPGRLGASGRLALPVLWLIALAGGLPFMSMSHFNPGLIELQVPHLESVEMIRTLQTWVAVVTSTDLYQLRQVRNAVEKLPSVKSTYSVLSALDNLEWLKQHQDQMPQVQWTPPAALKAADLPTVAGAARNLATSFDALSDAAGRQAATSLRNFAADLDATAAPTAAAARLSQWQTIFVDELKELLGQFSVTKLDMAAVPEELRGHLLSRDGYYALFIYPSLDLWQQNNLALFVNEVEKAVRPLPNAPTVTGIASNVYHTTESIHAAFYHATCYALALIFILVLLDFRRLGPTLAAVSVLGLGLPMLLVLMGYLNITWNFANFFGLPILIGAGHEYGVFMVHRYLEAKNHPRRFWARWDVSDRALLLCAYITSSSFGFFWLLAQHQGLKSLGLVMALGTACIYLATIIVLRPLLRWRLDRLRRKSRESTTIPV
jgi:predicted RND superfamily exporter protein